MGRGVELGGRGVVLMGRLVPGCLVLALEIDSRLLC